MINRPLDLTYLYLWIYVLLSSGVILYSKVVSPVKMTFEICATCEGPISAFFASSLWFGDTAYLHISVAFIQMLKALMLLQKKGLTLNPITSLYYIAPCSFVFLFVPWYLLEKPMMEVSQIQFNFWILFSNALCALTLNFSIFLVIGRTGVVTIRVAAVLKDWILIVLSTVIFPEYTITELNTIGYAIASCGVVMYDYIKVKYLRATQLLAEGLEVGEEIIRYIQILIIAMTAMEGIFD